MVILFVMVLVVIVAFSVYAAYFLNSARTLLYEIVPNVKYGVSHTEICHRVEKVKRSKNKEDTIVYYMADGKENMVKVYANDKLHLAEIDVFAGDPIVVTDIFGFEFMILPVPNNMSIDEVMDIRVKRYKEYVSSKKKS